MNYKTPEQILEDLRNAIGFHCGCLVCKKHLAKAIKEIHIYANHKTCECPNRSGATTNWTCHDCGKIVDDIECKLDNFIAS